VPGARTRIGRRLPTAGQHPGPLPVLALGVAAGLVGLGLAMYFIADLARSQSDLTLLCASVLFLGAFQMVLAFMTSLLRRPSADFTRLALAPAKGVPNLASLARRIGNALRAASSEILTPTPEDSPNRSVTHRGDEGRRHGGSASVPRRSLTAPGRGYTPAKVVTHESRAICLALNGRWARGETGPRRRWLLRPCHQWHRATTASSRSRDGYVQGC
jgi:hypothetical protein